jgi:hypothetical protein
MNITGIIITINLKTKIIQNTLLVNNKFNIKHQSIFNFQLSINSIINLLNICMR